MHAEPTWRMETMSQQTEAKEQGKLKWSDIKAEIESILDKRLSAFREELFESSATNTPSTATTPYMKPGKLIAIDEGDHQTVVCPTCGTTDLNFPKTTVEKEKVVEKVPDGYIPAPKTHAEIVKMLDVKDDKGHGVFDCPDCRGVLKEWLQKNKNQIQKL